MCDVYVNSDNQMKQHLSSLRHKNTVEGIPIPPKPGRDEKVKPKSVSYIKYPLTFTILKKSYNLF